MGYNDTGKPFVKEAVESVNVAKAEATANDLAGFLLLPSYKPYHHRACRRVGPGEYEQVRTRIFVFRHLLNPEKKWIPSKEEIRAGRKLDKD
jgi:hypothetical protein